MIDSKSQQYTELRNLIRKEIEELVPKIYDKLATAYDIPSSIPFHVHNGVDSPQINSVNIVNNIKYQSGITDSNVTGGTVTSTATLSKVPNISTITLSGFAANNAGGGAATKKALITGHAEFGKTYVVSSAPSTLNPQQFFQYSNSIYIDTASLANTTVNTNSIRLVSVVNQASSTISEVNITSYRDGTLTITSILAAGWQLNCNLSIS